jgi:hypothetical protein
MRLVIQPATPFGVYKGGIEIEIEAKETVLTVLSRGNETLSLGRRSVKELYEALGMALALMDKDDESKP